MSLGQGLFQYLRAFKQAHGQTLSKYAEAMHGSAVRAEQFTTEAIVLPLRVGTRVLGVITLHRRHPSTATVIPVSGVTTTRQEDLKEAAEDASGFVDAILQQARAKWREDESGRRNAVLKSLMAGSNGISLEDKVCAAIKKVYRASSVEIIKDERIGGLASTSNGIMDASGSAEVETVRYKTEPAGSCHGSNVGCERGAHCWCQSASDYR